MLGEVPDKVGHEMTVGAYGIVTVTDTYSPNCLLSKKSISFSSLNSTQESQTFLPSSALRHHADAALNGSGVSIKPKLTGS